MATTIHQAITRALTILNLPNVEGLTQDQLQPHVYRWRGRVVNFRPGGRKKEKIQLGPPQLSPKQKEVLALFVEDRMYNKDELAGEIKGLSISTLRSLVGKGMLKVEEKEGEEKWRKLLK